jgi:hypothetical protein
MMSSGGKWSSSSGSAQRSRRLQMLLGGPTRARIATIAAVAAEPWPARCTSPTRTGPIALIMANGSSPKGSRGLSMGKREQIRIAVVCAAAPRRMIVNRRRCPAIAQLRRLIEILPAVPFHAAEREADREKARVRAPPRSGRNQPPITARPARRCPTRAAPTICASGAGRRAPRRRRHRCGIRPRGSTGANW